MHTQPSMDAPSGPKIKNPLIKVATYALIAMVVGIGAAWVALGICSPVLLILLIQKW